MCFNLFLHTVISSPFFLFFFFFNDTATTEIYTLSLHDALPISPSNCRGADGNRAKEKRTTVRFLIIGAADRWFRGRSPRDRKSTRLNSSHSQISYAVFCLKKKKKKKKKKNKKKKKKKKHRK